MKYKRINIIKLLIIMTLLLVSMVGCGKNTARTIKVEELEGTASVTNNEGTLDAYEGQNLQSGDEVNVLVDSSLQLLLDVDKHVFATEGADFIITAEGTKGQTKTIIEQSSGAMLFGIDNKLGSEETFHVRTPNATMAVRGTVFSVKVNGDSTRLEVSEGTVYTETVENGELVTDTLTAGESGEYTGKAPETEDSKELGGNADSSGSDSSGQGIDEKYIAELQKEADEWIETVNIEWSVGNLVLGESTIADAKAAYSGDSGYMSNLMNDDTEDTVYSAPYTGETPEGYTSDTFGYLFTSPAEGGIINHMGITDKSIVCIGGVRAGDSADSLWNYLGIANASQIGDGGVITEGSNGRWAQISGQYFIFKEDGKTLIVEIKSELGIITYIGLDID